MNQPWKCLAMEVRYLCNVKMGEVYLSIHMLKKFYTILHIVSNFFVSTFSCINISVHFIYRDWWKTIGNDRVFRKIANHKRCVANRFIYEPS